MDNVTKQKIQEQLNKAQNIVISVSKKSGFDGLASGLALYLSIKKITKNVTIKAKAPTVLDAKMLYGVDKIGQGEDKKNLVVVLENAVKNVDKVTYFLDGDKLKIVIHALAQSAGISQNEISFESSQTKPDFIIGIGYSSPEELNSDNTHEQQLDPGIITVNLSQEDTSKKIAQYNLNYPGIPSIGEITCQFIELFALPIDEDIAFNLYSAIASATQMFSPKTAQEATLETAAWLLKLGAGRASLAQNIQNLEQEPRTFEPQAEKIPVQTTNFTQNVNALNYQTNRFENDQKPLEKVEQETEPEKDWLKPPKIYHGSKSFDKES